MTGSARLVDLGQEVPIGVVELELSEPLAPLGGEYAGTAWVAAIVVVKLHSVPIGMVVGRLSESGGEMSGPDLAALVEAQLGDRVRAHLSADGLDLDELRPAGIGTGDGSLCQAERRRTLADAPALSVIIPTRERAATLPTCIDSILACDYPRSSLEIVIVDNVPRDDSTRRVVDRYVADGHPLVYAREDAPGSASARNRGMRVGKDDIVVFTDDDALADRWWLAEIADTFRRHPDAGAVTGMLLPTDLETEPQLWFEQYGGFSRGWSERTFTTDRKSDPGNPLYPYAAGIFGTGNNMAFRRAALEQIGNFDPALGNGTPALGGVDSEVLQRTVLCGYPLVYQPRAVVWHSHRRDYVGLRKQVYSYGSGLTSYLMKTLLRNPQLWFDFCCRVPAGLRFAVSPTSDKNARKSTSYPPDLTRTEIRGAVHGLVAYPRSRHVMGPHVTPHARRPR